MAKGKTKIVVLAGGPSSEHGVSLKTAKMILKNLNPRKYKTSLVVIGKNKKWDFYPEVKKLQMGDAIKYLVSQRFDFAFIAMHGFFGEDGRIQSILEWSGLPYSGSGVLSSAMAMSKDISNILYKTNGLLVPRYIVLDKYSKRKINIGFPLVVKPVSGGSSVGVSIIKNKNEFGRAVRKAFKEDKRIMLQEYMKGREFTCGVLEGRDGKTFALPPTEIIPQSSSFFDYRAKYRVGGSLEITPARLPKEKMKELQILALKAHKILECRGMSRSDFMLKGSKFYILETNTIPGMTETSLLPQAAMAAGIEFPAFLDLMIDVGLKNRFH